MDRHSYKEVSIIPLLETAVAVNDIGAVEEGCGWKVEV
jgi:hypothetical protein